MSTATAPICEIKIDGGWTAISLSEARGRYRSLRKRCPACHGLVTVVGTYSPAARMGLSHYRRHAGCSLTPAAFSGVASRHPNALS